ncbi:hypothetical protein [Caproiciproducens galactitolivorans]|uniref:Glycosyl transferases group 1 n=1 Tax=Caproiciproducens galactitolivorans TaxID=642589 RepID=A0ABT4BRH5_9FIRM|nr:hypothetical protein [Caproiciproducens galactitolivorans]MCY1713491.1 hypothetical protein [Caproiciproducens galactitolivorans]
MERQTRILVECPALIASVRLGVLEPLKPLQEQGKCDVHFLQTKHIKKVDIAWCDIFICVRGFEYVSMKAAKAAKQAGRLVIYFLDDDLLNVPEDVGSKDYFSDESQKQALSEIINFCDMLWCVNPYLGEKYSRFGNKRWVMERVPVPLEHFSYEEHGTISILYAGSSDHTPVIREYITPVVRRLCEEFQGLVSFTFIGADPGLSGYENVEYIKFFEDYEDYYSFLLQKRFDIGLAPVRTTEFYQCKYYNKFIEYTKIGAVGVYTNSLPYTLVIQDGQNGFLCENTFEDWYNTLKKTIVDCDLRKRCAETAYNDLQEKFTYDKVGVKLLEDIPELTYFHAPFINKSKIKLKNMYFLFYVKRASLLWKKHGIFAIPIMFFKAIKRLRNYFFNRMGSF